MAANQIQKAYRLNQLTLKLVKGRKERTFREWKKKTLGEKEKKSIYASVYNLLGEANQILTDLHSAKKQKGGEERVKKMKKSYLSKYINS